MSRSPLVRLALIFGSVAILSAVAVVGTHAPPAGPRMAGAASAFIATLSPEQKQKALFPFDDANRTAWFFTPQQDKQKNPTRQGLRMDQMDEKQKKAALELLRTGLSGRGYEQATTIMSLEAILADLEKRGAMVRDPNWYFVSIFGEPSATGMWGWRIEGHHLSVNITLEKGEVVSATPVVFGANPAEVRQGDRKGLRTLPEIETLAKELIGSLSDLQKKVARQKTQFPEIRENTKVARPGEAVGITMADLNEEQRATLTKLMAAYANRLDPALASQELKRVQDAGSDKVRFAYCIEEDKKGQPMTYRIQGPTFLCEFLNTQGDSAGNPANHIHSGWRRLPADFGLTAE